MEQHIRVELIPRMVPVDEDVYAQRAETVERMAELDQIDPSTGTIPDTMQQGWLARINGVEFRVVTYGAEPAEAGAQALVSLLVPADSVSIGDPSTGVPEPQLRPAVPEPKKASSWGAPGPDPREGIPGWTPPTDEPVTVHFDTSVTVDQAAQAGRSARELLQRRFNDGVSGVPA